LLLVINFIAGESGLGKSTLVNSLFLSDLYPHRAPVSAAGMTDVYLISLFVCHVCNQHSILRHQKSVKNCTHTLRDYRYVTLSRKPQIRHGVIIVYLWISENGVTGVLTGTFWLNKFAKLGYITLLNRHLKTVTAQKNPQIRIRTDSRKNLRIWLRIRNP